MIDDWCVAVFRCRSDVVENTLVDLYDFVKDLEGVKDLHFIIRDRIDDDVVLSFRVFVDLKFRKVVESKMVYKLGSLVPKDKFSINPEDSDQLAKYSGWSQKDLSAKLGSEKFVLFCGFLSQLSKVVVNMVRSKYFDSQERVEISHVMSWMLGCTEYGSLSEKHMEVGYYDRITDKYHAYLKEGFHK